MTTVTITPKELRLVTGKPIDRVDGRLKVMGAAHYAAEFPLNNIAHAVMIQSTVASGRLQEIDVSAAETSPGVLAVITHRNAPKLNQLESENSIKGKPGEKEVPLQSDEVHYDGLFTDKPDPHISPLGVRGVGEIGITGVAAAIANAIYHATGKRIRELPITPEKLL